MVYHVLIEGPDGVGKSTIAKKLSSKMKVPLLKMVKAKKAFSQNTIEDLSYVFNQTLRQLNKISYVTDRGPLSSLIYSQIYNRKDDVNYVYKLLHDIQPIIVILTAKQSVILSRKKKDKVIDASHRKSILKLYSTIAKDTTKLKYISKNIISIDTSHLSPDEIVNKILHFLWNTTKNSKNCLN